MSDTAAPPGPRLVAITVRLSRRAGERPAIERQDLVLAALAQALLSVNNCGSHAWTVQNMLGGDPLSYTLAPLDSSPFTASSAGAIAGALCEQDHILGTTLIFRDLTS